MNIVATILIIYALILGVFSIYLSIVVIVDKKKQRRMKKEKDTKNSQKN